MTLLIVGHNSLSRPYIQRVVKHAPIRRSHSGDFHTRRRYPKLDPVANEIFRNTGSDPFTGGSFWLRTAGRVPFPAQYAGPLDVYGAASYASTCRSRGHFIIVIAMTSPIAHDEALSPFFRSGSDVTRFYLRSPKVSLTQKLCMTFVYTCVIVFFLISSLHTCLFGG